VIRITWVGNTVEFAYNDFGNIITTHKAMLFVGPAEYIVRLQRQLQVFFTVWSASTAMWSHHTSFMTK